MKRYRIIIPIFLLLLMITLGITSPVAMAQDFGNNWTGQYFSNTSFDTAGLVVTTIDSTINFNYGTGAPPYPGMPVDNFSIRWTGTQSIADGTYTFTATADDGVRVTVDGVIIIDQLGASGSFQSFTAQAILTGTTHTIIVEYVELTGNAAIQFQWQLTQAAGPSPTPGPTLTPSITPLPFIPPGSITATVIRASVLNVRDAPSLGGNRLGRILRGQTYAIVGRDPRARWFLLDLGGRRAWAYGYYLFVDGNEFTPPIASAATVQGFPAGAADTGVLGQTSATLKLRASPTTVSAQTGRITWGAFLPLIGRTSDSNWYQVVWKGTVGWAWSGFVKVRFGDINNVPITG